MDTPRCQRETRRRGAGLARGLQGAVGRDPLASESSILHPPPGHGHTFSRHPWPFRECPRQQEISLFLIKCQCVYAKSLQSCPTLCDPMDCSPPGSSVHGDSLGKKTGVGCHFLLQGNLQIRDQIRISYVSFICRRVLYHKRHLGL